MKVETANRSTVRSVDLIDRINMSPGERARAKARMEQTEALIDLAFALAARLRRGLEGLARQGVAPAVQGSRATR